MSLADAFRLSFYLSLALSCVCLFYGEWDFIPWFTALLPAVLALMFLAHRREGREYLSEQTANRLGTLIGLGTILWILLKVPRSDEDLIAGGVPWPAALVPLLAPLLPVLLLVKLFRPKKISDFWVFQAIALIIVTLSCILAGEVLFFLLLLAFLMVQLWCLALFFPYQHMVLAKKRWPGSWRKDAEHARPVALFGDGQIRDQTPIPSGGLRSIQVTAGSALILPAGLLFFFLLPRFTDSPWVPTRLSAPGRSTLKSGIDANLGIDPYREGIIELSKDPAFEVEVRDHHGAPGTLPLTQRWRLQVWDEYRRGNWTFWKPPRGTRRKPVPSDQVIINSGPFPERVPPGMQDDELFLIFHITARMSRGLPLADPVANAEHVGLFPLVANAPMATSPFFALTEESDTFVSRSGFHGKKVKFGQIFAPKFQSNEFPTVSIHSGYVSNLLSQEVPVAIGHWTRTLIRKLPDLDEADYGTNDEIHIVPAKYAKVTKALSRHLAESGEFSYSLRLHPVGITMDPTAEFLLKVKEGHCERFAAGLTLMLRSLDIPARIVKGYSGCELLEKGRYVVREDTAHSWVEALVPGRNDTRYWLQLDPTPSSSESSDSLVPFFNWAWARITNPDFAWKSLVMDFNTERQSEVGEQFQQLWHRLSNITGRRSTWEAVWNLASWPILALLCLMTVLMGRSIWRRRGTFWAKRIAKGSPLLEFYARLLRVLDRHLQLRPKTGQTPREFAYLARAALAARLSAEPSVHELPVRAVENLYQQRFGGMPLTPEFSQAIDAEVELLEKTLLRSTRR